jgi:hypothetical protein
VHIHNKQVSEPWAALLLSGAKPVETRSYPLPAALLNRKLAVIESSSAEAPPAAAAAAAASSVTDTVAAGAAGLSRTGTVTFTSCKRYTSEAEWAADEARHLVKSDSSFGWKAVAQRTASSTNNSGDSGAEIWAWTVGKRKTHKKARPVPHMRRVFRSLFALHYGSADATDDAAAEVADVAAAVVSSTTTKVVNSGSTSSSAGMRQAGHSTGVKRSRDNTSDAGYGDGNGTHKKSKRKKDK